MVVSLSVVTDRLQAKVAGGKPGGATVRKKMGVKKPDGVAPGRHDAVRLWRPKKAARRWEGARRARAGRTNVLRLGAKRRHSLGYGEHLQRRGCAFLWDERAWRALSHLLKSCRPGPAKASASWRLPSTWRGRPGQGWRR